MLGSVAVLESFGNAATCRNDNSSRFGTLLSLHYGHGLTLLGSQCSAYLLEKVHRSLYTTSMGASLLTLRLTLPGLFLIHTFTVPSSAARVRPR